MKAAKTIWFGNVPGKKPVIVNGVETLVDDVSGVHDRRIKTLVVGDDIPKNLIENEAIATRMAESGLIARSVDSDAVARAQDEARQAAEDDAKAAEVAAAKKAANAAKAK